MTMYTPQEIAEFVKRSELSVAELANRLGLHRTTVYHWLSGRSHPTFRQHEKLNEFAKKHFAQKVG